MAQALSSKGKKNGKIVTGSSDDIFANQFMVCDYENCFYGHDTGQ